jgi:sugar transferase (PEP-CTERM/EpsH1 system associated)
MARVAGITMNESANVAHERPIRVMHVMYMMRVAGMELGVAKLVNALDRSRITSSVCSCRPADEARQRLSSDIPLFELRRRHGNDLSLVGHLFRLMRRQRPDIVHTHAWGTLVEGLIAARLARVPLVVHGEHGTLDLRPRTVRVQRWAWGRVDQVLAVSSQLAGRMASEVGFPAERIRTIRNGVDLETFGPGNRGAARAALGLRDEDLVIGTVGRLVPVKDHGTLLDALALLRARGMTFRAIIAGEGPLRRALETRAATLGLEEVVSFIGVRPDIPTVLSAMDIFVLSSSSEGMSNTIQEAMATALPVVATRVGASEELLHDGHTGILVPPQQPGAMAEALEALGLAPAKRRAMGVAARLRAETLFDLAAMVSQYESLYRDLMATRGGDIRKLR